MTYQLPEPVEPSASASHPSVDQLADLYEDLLSPSESADLRAHLTGCAQCADTLAALSGLTDLLARDEPPAMPADVAQRIDAALAAEAATAAATATAAAGPAPRPVGRASAGAPPTRSDRNSRPGRSAFRRRAGLLLAAAGCLGVLGLGAALLDSGGPTTASTASRGAALTPGTASDGSLAPAASGPLYSAGQLPAQVRQLLTGASAGPGKSLPHATGQAQDDTPDLQLPACVQSAVGNHAGDSPLAVGHGRYGATAVDVYVFPLGGDPSRLDVYLLDAGCALHTPATPATVALHQVVPAP